MSDEIGAAEISQYLGDQSDFDLEMFVYRTLQTHGIRASHGGTYTDPVTKKFRQYDIRATKHFEIGYAISFAIECKSLTPEFPLVVLRVPRAAQESFHDVVRSWGREEHGERFFHTMRSAVGQGLYLVTDKVGKKVVQIGWDSPKHNRLVGSDRESYDKWSQALSSADDLLQETVGANLRRSVVEAFTFVMPILVVSDSTLWVADYTADGARDGEAVRVDETTLFVDRDYEIVDAGARATRGYHIGHLHILTRKGLLKLLKDVSSHDSKLWDCVFPPVTHGRAR